MNLLQFSLSDRASSSKDTVLCACDCANCKGTFYCYSTVRRHHSIFGVNTQAGLRLEGLGVSCGTREASVADDDSIRIGTSKFSDMNNCDNELSDH
ncbi:hypothetical protein EMCRGX_G013604 [Ephydatia muelleri]